MAVPLSKMTSPAVLARFPQERYGDAQLVRDVAAGDREAFGIIWDRYSRLVRGVLYGAVGPDSSAEDLLQEVFLGFFRGAPRIKDGTLLRSYLIGVAVRTAAVELRRRKVRRWVGLTSTGDVPEFPVLAADNEGRESLRALYRVLDTLSSRRRMAFVLRHVEGLELLEIAAALTVSESTVRRELARAEQQLVALARREPALADYLERSRSLKGAQ